MPPESEPVGWKIGGSAVQIVDCSFQNRYRKKCELRKSTEMARPKAFDRDAVLEKAMQTFWERGYEATSIRDLVTATGINRGSLYATFGDKRRLFQDVLAHYDRQVVRQAIARLEAPGASKPAIVEHFRELAAADGADCRGCLMTNAAVELGIRDPELRCQIAANFQRVEDAFFKALTRAQDKGEIGAAADTRAIARHLTCTMQGLRALSKLRPDPTVLQSIVAVALSVLEAPAGSTARSRSLNSGTFIPKEFDR